MTGKITGALREQSDWEQQDEHRLGFIKNKPFYDTRKTEPLTLKWDGEIGSRDTFKTNRNTYVKMTNETPTDKELDAATFHVTCSEGSEENFPSIGTSSVQLAGRTVCSFGAAGYALGLVIDEDFAYETVSYKKGLYLVKRDFTSEGYGIAFIDTVHIPSYEIGELKALDEKYIPESAQQNWLTFDIADLTGFDLRSAIEVAIEDETKRQRRVKFDNAEFWAKVDQVAFKNGKYTGSSNKADETVPHIRLSSNGGNFSPCTFWSVGGSDTEGYHVHDLAFISTLYFFGIFVKCELAITRNSSNGTIGIVSMAMSTTAINAEIEDNT